MLRNSIKQYRVIFNVINRIIKTDFLSEIIAKNFKNNKSSKKNEKKNKKNNKKNNKKIDNNKNADNDILNVLFVNITSITISKYVNISIKKIYNNSL
jgi:Na+/glutamate symporter